MPRVVAELQDTALVSALGELGLGLFAASDTVMTEPLRARGVKRVAPIPGLRERYYAITVERRIEHPAIAAVVRAARERLFKTPRASPRRTSSRAR